MCEGVTLHGGGTFLNLAVHPGTGSDAEAHREEDQRPADHRMRDHVGGQHLPEVVLQHLVRVLRGADDTAAVEDVAEEHELREGLDLWAKRAEVPI